MLSGSRVLDLADEKGLFCAKVLGDIGADVIKIEKPGGDQARNIGPFYHDTPDPEKSLFWFALNANKRGITLNIETADGRDIFKKLIPSADFLTESFPPGYMDKLGLGYSVLSKINPRLIMVAITPFGQNGPYADYKCSDIVAMAVGGFMNIIGDPDRAPLRCSVEQAHFLAGLQAATGAMLAHYYRELTNEGQYVDVSMQESVVACLWDVLTYWELASTPRTREGSLIRRIKGRTIHGMFPCKDGYVSWRIYSGQQGRLTQAVVEMMKKEGTGEEFSDIDWERVDLPETSQEQLYEWEEYFGRFFLKHTKAELQQMAMEHGAVLMPSNDVKDLLENEQLAARDFWSNVNYPELGISLPHPSCPFKINEASLKISRRAPLIGEHNREIYQEEPGFSEEQIIILKQAGVI